MITLEEIKELYPEGCEFECAIDKKDKSIFKKELIEWCSVTGSFYICSDYGRSYLYNTAHNKFATIINPAPKNQLSKYHVPCKGVTIDVYDVLKAFNVVNPATQHAIKKLLKGGERGFKDVNKDYQEAIESIERAIELNK
jgi:hypothetical protein